MILLDEITYIKLLKDALEIFSPSGKEEEMSQFLFNLLQKLGYSNVRIDRIGNVIGEIGENRPIILLSSHLDTINDNLPVYEDDEKLYGRGAVDAKGPLMALLLGASKFSKKKLNGKIIFAGIVQEEISTKGIDEFLNSGVQANYAIFAEPNNTNNIVVAYKGRALLQIVMKSKKGSGHPASAWLFDNTIELAHSFYLKIKEFFNINYRGRTPYFSAIPTITEFYSSEGKNVIPSRAKFYIDLRFPIGINFNDLISGINKLKEDFIKSNNCIIDIEILSLVLPYSTDPKQIFIQKLSESIEKVLNVKSKLTRKTGTTFMNVIGNKLGIPTISIGPGDPKLEHTKEEFIYKKDFLHEIKIIEDFIENFLGLQN